MNIQPYQITGKKLNKLFSMALGHMALDDDVVDVAAPLRQSMQGLKNNIYSIRQLAQEGYVPIFEEDSFKIYDTSNTKTAVSRDTVLQGYFCHKKYCGASSYYYKNETATQHQQQ